MAGPEGVNQAAMTFSGLTSSSMVIKSTAKLDTRHSITILAWIYAGSAGPIFNFGSVKGLGLHLQTSGNDYELEFSVRKRGLPLADDKASTKIKANTWTYVAATYDSETGEAKLYIGSKRKAMIQLTANTELFTNEDIYIGSLPGAESFQGGVACVRIYNRALPLTEIQTGNNCPVGEWKFIF